MMGELNEAFVKACRDHKKTMRDEAVEDTRNGDPRGSWMVARKGDAKYFTTALETVLNDTYAEIKDWLCDPFVRCLTPALYEEALLPVIQLISIGLDVKQDAPEEYDALRDVYHQFIEMNLRAIKVVNEVTTVTQVISTKDVTTQRRYIYAARHIVEHKTMFAEKWHRRAENIALQTSFEDEPPEWVPRDVVTTLLGMCAGTLGTTVRSQTHMTESQTNRILGTSSRMPNLRRSARTRSQTRGPVLTGPPVKRASHSLRGK